MLSVLGTLVIRAAGSAVTVLFALVVSRYMETGAAAHFFLLFNITVVAAICFRWGLDEVIIRKVASAPTSERLALAHRLIWLAHRRVIQWTAASLTAAVLLLHPNLRALMTALMPAEIVVAAVASAMVALVACIGRVYQGLGRTSLAAFLLNILIPMMSLIGLLLMVSQRWDIGALDMMLLYASVAIGAYAIVMAPYYWMFRARIAESKSTSIGDALAERQAANKLGGVVMAQQILIWGALFCVPFAYGDLAYNGFIVAQKISTLVSLVMLAANFTLAPRFAQLYASRNMSALRTLTRTSAMLILLSSIAIAGLVFMARDIPFNFARISTDMTIVVAILLIGQVFFALSASLSIILSMSLDETFLLYAQGGINVAGVIVFIWASFQGEIELACLAFPGAYLVLAIVLASRARVIGAL
ncbi:MAG: hypothetical protein CMJ17_14070 [Phenylobacterium sp.]|nr:hypothetical protein [Phenylobacterium sp.]